ncbi:MAG: DUF3504 domain-containing protein [Candidatus Thiodiazotropha taylori]|nr:DUF3504 domain-containing protein [Candidatus Thiodiazotropha taylori]
MDVTDDLLLSQIADDMEKEYIYMNNALNDSVDDILLSQAVDFVDMTLSQAFNVYEIDLSNEASFDLGFSPDQFLDNKENVNISKLLLKADTKNENASSRFAAPVTDFDIQQLKSSKINKNTAKSTRWCVTIFETWKSARAEAIPDFLIMDKQTMSFWLTRFIMEVRNAKGGEYPPKTLYMIVCGLLRHLRENGVHDRNFLDSKDPDFAEFCSVLDLRMKDLLQKGYGTTVKQADPLSLEDEEKLWNLSVFGAKDSETLQHTVFYYSCKLFGLRGTDEHRELQCNQFEIGDDAAAGKYVRFIGRSNKTYKGGLGQMSLTNKDIKHYCVEGM